MDYTITWAVPSQDDLYQVVVFIYANGWSQTATTYTVPDPEVGSIVLDLAIAKKTHYEVKVYYYSALSRPTVIKVGDIIPGFRGAPTGLRISPLPFEGAIIPPNVPLTAIIEAVDPAEGYEGYPSPNGQYLLEWNEGTSAWYIEIPVAGEVFRDFSIDAEYQGDGLYYATVNNVLYGNVGGGADELFQPIVLDENIYWTAGSITLSI